MTVTPETPLIFAEISDGQPERVDGQHLVANLLAKHVDDIGGPQLALQLCVVERAEDLVKLDSSGTAPGGGLRWRPF